MGKSNLHYESNEPAFLQRLRGQFGGNDDRYERQIARPRKQLIDGDIDDGPTYVDESNESISKEDYERMVNPDSEEASQRKATTTDSKATEPESKDEPSQTVPKKAVEASIGTKKRRLAKAVGTNDDDQKDEASEPTKKSVKKSLKKQKVKLSFDEDP